MTDNEHSRVDDDDEKSRALGEASVTWWYDDVFVVAGDRKLDADEDGGKRRAFVVTKLSP